MALSSPAIYGPPVWSLSRAFYRPLPVVWPRDALRAPERASSKLWTVYRPQRQTARVLCRKRRSSHCRGAVATAVPHGRARRGLQGPSCKRQGGGGSAQKLRRVTYVWLQDHLIG